MNIVGLIGRLTSKPELKYTNSNIPFSRFSIAVNRNFGDKKETDFINILAWRKQAENVCEYQDKGNLISIEGRIQTGSYEDKETGKKRSTFDVVADNIGFLESKKDGQAPIEDKPSEKNIDNDPFADFGDSVSVDDNFLE